MNDGSKPTLLVLASTYPRWSNDSEPGFVHELCRRLTTAFHVIALVPAATGADASVDLDGVEVIRFGYAPRRWQTLAHSGGIVVNLRRHRWKWALVPSFVLAQYLAARRILRRRPIALIHAHWLLPQGLIARQLARTFRVPYVVTSHGGDLFGLRGRIPTALKRTVARDCAAMTVVSGAMREESARLRLRPRRLDVVPMGVDLRGRFLPDASQARGDDELLFVGRLVPKKGLHHLLAALPLVLQERPAVRLTIVGSGPEQAALEAQAQRLGIAHALVLAGAKGPDELPALFRRASLFVSPFIRDESGDQEGLPVTLMEAIGCGCPPIVGNVAGLEDLLGPASSDVCVDPSDGEKLASLILRDLANPAAARTRALELRERILQHLDWSVIAARYAELLLAQTGESPGLEATH